MSPEKARQVSKLQWDLNAEQGFLLNAEHVLKSLDNCNGNYLQSTFSSMTYDQQQAMLKKFWAEQRKRIDERIKEIKNQIEAL